MQRIMWTRVSLLLMVLLTIAASTEAFYIHPQVIVFSQEPEDTITCEGCPVELSCKIPVQNPVSDLPKPGFKWQVNGTDITVPSTDYEIRSHPDPELWQSTLVIPRASSGHTGLYRCVVSDGNEPEHGGIKFEEPCSTNPCIDTYTISREASLQVITYSSDAEAVELASCSSTVLSCGGYRKGHGSRVLAVQWRRNKDVLNSRVDNTTAVFQLENGDLFVANDSLTDVTGSYECLVSFDGGDTITVAQYDVKEHRESSDEATVEVYTSSSTIAVGETVQLLCMSVNYCFEDVSWTKNGSDGGIGSGGFHGNLLTLESVEVEDGGRYCCEGVRGGDVRSDCVELHVVAMPIVSSPQQGSTVLLNMTGSDTHNLSLDCNIDNKQQILLTNSTIEWYHNGLPINSSFSMEHSDDSFTVAMVTETGQLVIIGYDVVGVYQCFVSNEAGTASVTTRVLPWGRPNPPGTPSIREILKYSNSQRQPHVRVTWRPPEYTAGLTELLYNISYNGGQSRKITDETVFEEKVFIGIYYFRINLIDPITLEATSEATANYLFVKDICDIAYAPPVISFVSCGDGTATVSWAVPSRSSLYYRVLLYNNCTAKEQYNERTEYTDILTVNDLPTGSCWYGAASLPDNCTSDDECCFEYEDLLWNYTNCTITASVALDLPTGGVNESSGVVEVCAVSQGLGFEATVTLEDITTQRSKDYHYNGSALLLRFSTPGINRQCASIYINNDSTVEESEKFSVTLSSSDPAVVITVGTSVVTILDDDYITVGIEKNSYYVEEGKGNISVCVVVEGELERNAIVVISAESEDFSIVEGTIMLPSSECVVLEIIDDNFVESENETHQLTLNSSDPNVQISQGIATVIIGDNDNITVRFENNSYFVEEGRGNLRVCVVFEGELERDTAVVISAESEDFFILNETIMLPSSECVVLEIIDDNFVESENETHQLNLSSSDPSVQISQGIATVIIGDNDSNYISLSVGLSLAVAVVIVAVIATVIAALLILRTRKLRKFNVYYPSSTWKGPYVAPTDNLVDPQAPPFLKFGDTTSISSLLLLQPLNHSLLFLQPLNHSLLLLQPLNPSQQQLHKSQQKLSKASLKESLPDGSGLTEDNSTSQSSTEIPPVTDQASSESESDTIKGSSSIDSGLSQDVHPEATRILISSNNSCCSSEGSDYVYLNGKGSGHDHARHHHRPELTGNDDSGIHMNSPKPDRHRVSEFLTAVDVGPHVETAPGRMEGRTGTTNHFNSTSKTTPCSKLYHNDSDTIFWSDNESVPTRKHVTHRRRSDSL